MMKRALFLILVVSFGCGDCGDERGLVEERDLDNPNNIDSDVGEDVAPDVVEDPDNFPGFVEVAVLPGKTTYQPGDVVTVDVDVFDVFGAETEAYATEVVVTSGAAEQTEDGFVLSEEGPVSFEACTIEPGRDGTPICNVDTIIVNAGPPVITLDFPPPGAELDATQFPDSITISGSVEDTYGTPTVYVAGVQVDVADDGSFSSAIDAKLGINHIVVEATDGLSDVTSSVHADVLWAQFYDPIAPTNVSFDSAFQLKLGQSLLDDRTAPVVNADGSISFNDIADLLKLVIENADLNSVVPDPVVNSPPSFFLRVPSVDVGDATSQVDFTDDGMEIYLRLPNIVLTTQGSIQVDSTTVSLTGTVSASVAALVDVTIEHGDAQTPVRVIVNSVSVAVEEASSNFASAEANAIFLLAAGALRTTIENLVVDALSDAFLDQVPTLLEEIFRELGDVIAENVIPLDTGFGSAIDLTIGGEITAVDIDDALIVDTRFDASTAEAGLHTSRGLARFFAPGPPEFFDADFEVGVQLQLLNGILAVLWQSGILDIDVTDAVPIAVEQAQLSAQLPPVARPPDRGEPFDAMIELGQLELATDVNGRQDVYGVSLGAGVSIAFDNGEFALTLAPVPEIRTWVISSSEETSFLTPTQLEGLIRDQLWPDIQATISDGIAIPIPDFDLSSLGGVAPSLAGATLGLNGGRATSLRDGFFFVEGVLEGLVP